MAADTNIKYLLLILSPAYSSFSSKSKSWFLFWIKTSCCLHENNWRKYLKNDQESIHFQIASSQEAYLKEWEEEKEKYAFWNLILDKHDFIWCKLKEAVKWGSFEICNVGFLVVYL